jgi:hypothetical protein
LSAFLDSWRDRLTARSRHLLAGAAQLDAYLTLLDQMEPRTLPATGTSEFIVPGEPRSDPRRHGGSAMS